jgi:hypothetical protein
MKMALYIILMIMMALGCTKQPMPSPCLYPDCRDTVKWVFHRPDSFGIMPVQWYTLGHTPDTSYCAEICFSVPEGVIAIRPSANGLKPRAYVRLLDRETGEEIWYWDKMPVDHYTHYQFYPERNMILVKYWYYDAILDISTGQEILYEKEPKELWYKATIGAIIGDYYYTSVYYESNSPADTSDYAQLIRMKLGTSGQWEKVFTRYENTTKGYSSSFYNIGYWINPYTQDSILLINDRLKMRNGAWKERSDVVAYNLSQRRVEWTIDSITKVSDLGDFITEGNYLFFPDRSKLKKINLLSPQESICEANTYGGYGLSNGRHLISQSLGINTINKDDCSTLWEYNDKNFSANGLELFEGYIYTQDDGGDLYVFNATTGKIVFQHFSQAMFVPQSVLGMDGRCSVDKEHRLLYAADKYGVYCMKLPEKWE